jgi:hypothetical protein
MNKKLLTLALVALFSQPNAYAIDLGHEVTLKGFGTVGIANSSTGNADFVSNSQLQPTGGVGRTNSLGISPDTKVGLQIDWQATSRLSITSQAISKQGIENSWVPELQLAFAKFKLLPDLDIRAGRLRPPIYMLSDYMDVNYANPWIRPPVEFYSSASTPYMEGVDFLYRPQTGPVSWLIQPYFGTSNNIAGINGTSFTAKSMLGANISASLSDFTLRAGYLHDYLTMNIPAYTSLVALPLTTLCQRVHDPVACAELPALAADGKDTSFTSVGANWDNGAYFVSGELGWRNSKSYFAPTTVGYITSGARFGKFTPYVMYSQVANNGPKTFTGGLAPTNAIITSLYRANGMDQNTKTLGIRYDVLKNIDIKAQWDRIDTSTAYGLPSTGQGLFVNATTAFKNGDNAVDIFSVAVDFIF